MIAALLAAGVVGGGAEDWRALLALMGIGFVAWVGWRDDRRSLGVGSRLLAHLLSASALLPLATTLPAVVGLSTSLGLAWWVFWGVSAINVVNFMDGIDGLIGAQVAVFGVHLALVGGSRPDTLLFAAALSGSALGFLCWNWAPARIFLGDAGSGALGLATVLGGLLALRGGGSLVTTFLPLFPIFLDASLTLVARARRGERLTEAHRSHLYQRLANGGWGHARVTVAYTSASAAAIGAGVAPSGYRAGVVAGYLLAVTVLGLVLSRLAGPPPVPARNG